MPVRRSARIAEFDNTSAGSYFVTICLNDMSQLRLGSLESGELTLNEAGVMVADCWESTLAKFPGTAFDSMVVMPNHLHAIVFIGTDLMTVPPNLTSAIGAFKSIATVEYIRGVKEGRFPPFEKALWQRSFHDRILRSQKAIEIARLYIEGNPARWATRLKDNQPT